VTPGSLPEIAASPGYDPFVDFRERAMFQQSWSAYGVQWPVIRHSLGLDPDVPDRKLAVIPDIPESWPGLLVKNLRVGEGVVAVSAERSGNVYKTVVSAPAGLAVTLGHTLPVGATVESVLLDGAAVEGQVVDSPRGREVRVGTSSDAPRTLNIRAR